jgi:P-type E1-E2 ATPase
MVLTQNNVSLGIIAVADTIRSEARAAIEHLRRLGIESYMLTGDNRRTAEAVARSIGIGSVRAEVLPSDKSAEIAKLQAE